MRFLLRCLAYFKPDLPRIIWSLVLTFLATLVALLQPIVVTVLFDNILRKQAPPPAGSTGSSSPCLPADRKGQIIGLAVLGLLVTIVGGAADDVADDGGGEGRVLRPDARPVRAVREAPAAQPRLPPRRPQGDSIYRLSYDTYGFQTILNIVVGNFLVSAVMLLVMAWIMFSMNWGLALMSMVGRPAARADAQVVAEDARPASGWTRRTPTWA